MITTAASHSQANLYNSKYFMAPPQAMSSAGPSPPETYVYGQGSQSLSASPTSSTSNTQSPTSTSGPNRSTQHIYRQLRPLRHVGEGGYIPAALRPSDYPTKATRPTSIPNRPRAPDTPPTSKDNSFDSGKSGLAVAGTDTRLSFGGRTEDENIDRLRQSISNITIEDLAENLGEVKGPPTTAHWKPDVTAKDCAVCHTTFTWFFRRHHCRQCGNVICDTHSKKLVPLDQNAHFHPEGQMSKSCDVCFDDYSKVEEHLKARLEVNRRTSTPGLGNDLDPNDPMSLVHPRTTPVSTGRQTQQPEQRGPSVARSLGLYDQWSTF